MGNHCHTKSSFTNKSGRCSITCIVGIKRDNEIWVGCDSAVTDTFMSKLTIIEPKVFVLDDQIVMGYCGSPRLAQLLEYGLNVPERSARTHFDMEWLTIDFVDSIREHLAEKCYILKENGTEDSLPDGCLCLFGYRGELYTLESNFQIIQSTNDYMSVGSGSDLAHGALYTMYEKFDIAKNYHPAEIINNALEAATHHNASCGKPFHIFKMSFNDNETEISKIV